MKWEEWILGEKVLWASQVFCCFVFSQVLESSVSQKEVFLSALYSCLNRAILYCLSRPQQSLPEKFNVLNTLLVLQEQWDIIFATYNSNSNFVICLMYCLCQLNSGRYKCSSHYNVCLYLCAVPMEVAAEGELSQNLGNIQFGESLEAEIELDPAFPAAYSLWSSKCSQQAWTDFSGAGSQAQQENEHLEIFLGCGLESLHSHAGGHSSRYLHGVI